MIVAFLVIEAVIIVACMVVVLWAQQRFDLIARFFGRLAESMGATRFLAARECPGCKRKVRWMKVVPPAGYRCLTCSGNPPHPRETPRTGRTAK
jgi:hypothetical protein